MDDDEHLLSMTVAEEFPEFVLACEIVFLPALYDLVQKSAENLALIEQFHDLQTDEEGPVVVAVDKILGGGGDLDQPGAHTYHHEIG